MFVRKSWTVFSFAETCMRSYNLPSVWSKSTKTCNINTTTKYIWALALPVLLPVSFIWATISTLRNVAFDQHWLKVHSLDAPVICVGNLAVGGTGKTPMVEAIVRLLRQSELRRELVILTRGYGSDEDVQLSSQCPSTRVVSKGDRVEAATNVLKAADNKRLAFVLDDGLQHRRLGRDLNIVMVDAILGFGRFETTLPAGILRELPQQGLRRADAIVVHNSNLVSDTRLTRLSHRIREIVRNPEVLMCTSTVSITGFERIGSSSDNSLSPTSAAVLSAPNMLVVCGVGGPEAVHELMTQSRPLDSTLSVLSYGDHFSFGNSTNVTSEILDYVAANAIDVLVTTEKDYSRCPEYWSSLASQITPNVLMYIVKVRLTLVNDVNGRELSKKVVRIAQ